MSDKKIIYVVDTAGYHGKGYDESRYYDDEKFLVSLQGVLNREAPRLYVEDTEDRDRSRTYWSWLRQKPTDLLAEYERVDITDREQFLEVFREEILSRGLVVWDPAVPATANVAATVCGVDGYLPVMYSTESDSLFQRLTGFFGAPVKLMLSGQFGGTGTVWDTDLPSAGTAKLDAYLWAIEHYLKPGRCSREYLAYMVDYYPISRYSKQPHWLDNSIYESYLPDQDFLIAKGAFFVDLDMFSHEAAGDDPAQQVGDDYRMLCKILDIQYHLNNGAFSQCVGFAPFVYKYCSTAPDGGREDMVMAEWVLVEVMSAYNVALQADCPGPSSIHNCSVYTHCPRPQGYSQAAKRPRELPAFDPDKRYIMVYCGDYDAASWTSSLGAKYWDQGGRGEVPLSWGFNPNLAERIPHVFDHFVRTATDLDVFVGGDSGAGYINANLLQEGKRKHSSLPDGLAAWSDWCRRWYEPLDITVSAFLLDGNNGYATPQVLEAYSRFSPDGIGVWNWPGNFSGFAMAGDTAVTGMPQNICLDQNADAETNAQHLTDYVSEARELPFYQIKSNLVPPRLAADSVKLAQQRDPRIVALDAYTFYAMIRRELTGH